MIGKSGSGWQTTTADLALILFLVVSAAAVGRPSPGARGGVPDEAQRTAASLGAGPSAAIYRATAGTPFPQWLQSQDRDDRLVATVLVTRSGGGEASPVLQQAFAFLDQIEASGRTGRLVVERGPADDVAVVLAYDRASDDGTGLAAR